MPALARVTPGTISKTVQEQVQTAVIKMYFCILLIVSDRRRHTLGNAVFCREESFL